MTVAPNSRITILAPAAGTTVLNWDFLLRAPEELLVRRRRAGQYQTLNWGADFIYPAGLGSEGGGALQLLSASLAGDRYELIGRTAERRPSDFSPQNAFATNKQNADLDHLTRLTQEHRRDLDAGWRSEYGKPGGLIASGVVDHMAVYDAAGNISQVPNFTVTGFLASVAAVAENLLASASHRVATLAAATAASLAAGLAAGYANDAFTKGEPQVISTVEGLSALNIGAGVDTLRFNWFAAKYDTGAWPLAVEVANTGPLEVWQRQSNSGTRRWQLSIPDGLSMSPEMFRANGNGVFDNYAAFKAMSAYVNLKTTGVINFKAGANYYIDQYVMAGNGVTDFAYTFVSGLFIYGNGAKISLKGNFNRGVSTTRGLSAFSLTGCRRVVIDGIEVNGNVQDMTKSAGIVEAATYAIVLGSCFDVDITNNYLHHMATDAISVRENTSVGTNPRIASRRVHIRGNRCTYNARMGLSVIALRTGTIEDNDFSYTARAEGLYGGHSPACGVDVEPNRNTSTAAPNQMDINCGELIFRNNRIEENVGASFVLALPASIDTVTLEKNTFICADNGTAGGGDGFIADCPGLRIIDNTFDMRSKFLYMGYVANVLSDIRFDRNNVRGKSSRILFAPVAVRLYCTNNHIVSYRTEPIGSSGDYTLNFSNSKMTFEGNYFFMPKEAWAALGSTDRCPAAVFSIQTARRNRYETDLPASYGASANAHFFTNHGSGVLVESDVYAGLDRGIKSTYRPGLNSTFDTTKPFSLNNA